MAEEIKSTRLASPCQRYQIGQTDLGLLNSVAVGAVYEIGEDNGGRAFDATSTASFYWPLTYVASRDPWLSCVVRDGSTNKPYFERVPKLDLEKHVEILDGPGSSFADADAAALQNLLPGLLDKPWPPSPGQPQWRIVVLPLSSQSQPETPNLSRFLLVFIFRHHLADGMSGLNFHHNFLTAIQKGPSPSTQRRPSTITNPEEPPPAGYDTPTSMQFTWGYLFGTIAHLFFPHTLLRMLNIRTPLPKSPAANWSGKPQFKASTGAIPERTALRVLEIPPTTLDRALSTSRAHGAKLTAVVHQLILHALAATLPDVSLSGKKNFVAMTALNFRGALGLPADAPGDMTGGSWEEWDIAQMRAAAREGAGIDWAAAAAMTRTLATAVSSTTDSPMAMLRYVPDIRALQKGFLGKPRDSTYLLSNLGVLKEAGQGGEGGADSGRRTARITKALFATPAWVTGGALCFDLVSVEGREMVFVVSWQIGALGVGEEREGEIVDGIFRSIKEGFEKL